MYFVVKGRRAYKWGARGLICGSLQYGVFFGRANVFARESAMVKLQKRGRNGASQGQWGRGREEFQRTEFPKEQWYRAGVFFLISPSHLSLFLPSTYPKGCYFYSPQSSSGIKSKMAATTIRTYTSSFRPPKIRLHRRLDSSVLVHNFCYFYAAHREDIGLECHSLAKLLSSKVYWKGIQFSTSNKPSSLQHVHISEAYEAMRGGEFLPDLYNCIVKNSLYGLRSDEMNSPLTIRDSSIRDNKLAGIQIRSRSMDAKILNTVVKNTTNGDGLSYYGTVADPVDFCSVDENNILFPIAFQALGKASTRVDCAKVGIEFICQKINLVLH